MDELRANGVSVAVAELTLNLHNYTMGKEDCGDDVDSEWGEG